MHRILLSILPLAGIVLPPVVLASEPPDLVTDRPDQTESTEIVPRGWVQAELGAGDEDMGELLGTGLARVGLGGAVELRVGLDDTEAGTDRSLGVKAKFFEERGRRPAVSVIVAAADRGGDTDLRPALRVCLANTIGERLSIGYNAGIAWDEGATSGSLTSRFEWTAALGISAGKRTGFFIEAFGDTGMSDGGAPRTSIDGGATWLVRGNVQLDVFAGAGLSDAAADWFAGAGVSFRLPR